MEAPTCSKEFNVISPRETGCLAGRHLRVSYTLRVFWRPQGKRSQVARRRYDATLEPIWLFDRTFYLFRDPSHKGSQIVCRKDTTSYAHSPRSCDYSFRATVTRPWKPRSMTIENLACVNDAPNSRATKIRRTRSPRVFPSKWRIRERRRARRLLCHKLKFQTLSCIIARNAEIRPPRIILGSSNRNDGCGHREREKRDGNRCRRDLRHSSSYFEPGEKVQRRETCVTRLELAERQSRGAMAPRREATLLAQRSGVLRARRGRAPTCFRTAGDSPERAAYAEGRAAADVSRRGSFLTLLSSARRYRA